MTRTTALVASLSLHFHQRSIGVLSFLEGRLGHLLRWWLALLLLACAVRLLASPLAWESADGSTFLPYVLLIGAPIASLMLGLRWFADSDSMPQPASRFARIGRWRSVSLAEARRDRLYGTSGVMVSLLVGMLLNVPVRAAEYLATMPAISAAAPGWLATLHFWMTLDAVLVSSLYAICFAAAIRRMPLFPRLLVLTWLVDVTMQLMIAKGSVAAGLPSTVASALHGLLDGNVTKVMISMGLWLPYLLLSRRVNITYRRRIPA